MKYFILGAAHRATTFSLRLRLAFTAARYEWLRTRNLRIFRHPEVPEAKIESHVSIPNSSLTLGEKLQLRGDMLKLRVRLLVMRLDCARIAAGLSWFKSNPKNAVSDEHKRIIRLVNAKKLIESVSKSDLKL